MDKFHHSFHFISFHFDQSLTLKSTPFLRIWTSFTNPPLVLDSPLPYIQLGPNKYHYFGTRKMGYNGLKSVIIHQRHIGRYLKNGVLRSIAHVIKYANFQIWQSYLTAWRSYLENLTIDDKFINFLYIKRFVEKKK